MAIPIDDKARSAFFSHYVSGFSKTYDILEWLYDPTEGHLAASVDAVSLVFFATQFSHMDCFQIARQKYSHALRLLIQALQSPGIAKSDSTFLAVLFLDLFEKMINKNTQCSEAWMSHVNGALALIDLRGHDRLVTRIGARLSTKLVTNLIVSCVSASLEVPSGLIKLRYDLEPLLDKSDPKWRLTGLVTKYANFRAAVRGNTLSNDDIVTEAIRIDQGFILLAQDMPNSWNYEREHLEKPSTSVLEQHFDIYPDHYICQTWNVLRVIRIMLNDLVRKSSTRSAVTHAEVSPNRYKSEVATITIDSIAYEICASVPQFTRYPTVYPSDSLALSIRRLQCYTLLFPLYVAASKASPSTDIKQWILNQLDYLSSTFGIRNSALVAEFLRKAPEMCPWEVHNFVGSYAFSA